MAKKSAKKPTRKSASAKSGAACDKKRWALAVGIWWGAAMVLLAWFSAWFGVARPIVHLIGSVYVGYSASLLGGLIGGVWGFVDLYIGVWILLWIYEKLGCK